MTKETWTVDQHTLSLNHTLSYGFHNQSEFWVRSSLLKGWHPLYPVSINPDLAPNSQWIDLIWSWSYSTPFSLSVEVSDHCLIRPLCNVSPSDFWVVRMPAWSRQCISLITRAYMTDNFTSTRFLEWCNNFYQSLRADRTVTRYSDNTWDKAT